MEEANTMRKALLYGLSLAMLLSLAACGKPQVNQQDTSQPDTATTSAATSELVQEPTTPEPVTPEPVKDTPDTEPPVTLAPDPVESEEAEEQPSEAEKSAEEAPEQSDDTSTSTITHSSEAIAMVDRWYSEGCMKCSKEDILNTISDEGIASLNR